MFATGLNIYVRWKLNISKMLAGTQPVGQRKLDIFQMKKKAW